MGYSACTTQFAAAMQWSCPAFRLLVSVKRLLYIPLNSYTQRWKKYNSTTKFYGIRTAFKNCTHEQMLWRWGIGGLGVFCDCDLANFVSLWSWFGNSHFEEDTSLWLWFGTFSCFWFWLRIFLVCLISIVIAISKPKQTCILQILWLFVWLWLGCFLFLWLWFEDFSFWYSEKLPPIAHHLFCSCTLIKVQPQREPFPNQIFSIN